MTQLHKVYLVNRQVVGQHCGWGEGETREEAIANAIERAGGDARDATYDEASGTVSFDGGCYL